MNKSPNIYEYEQQNQMQNDGQFPQPTPANQALTYTFSPDELRVLKECNIESFFQRSLPFGIGFGVSAYFGVKHGYLKPNLSYGPVPKVITGVIIGYFLGKVSYQQKCAEKIMLLPNSKFGDLLRQRQSGGMGTLLPDQNFGLSTFAPPYTSDVYSDEHARYNKSSSLDLDTNRPIQPGLDDTYRPSLDNFNVPEESEVKPRITYEELRRRNREEYAKKQQALYSKPAQPDNSNVNRSYEKPINETDDFTSQPSTKNQRKNKYGDAWTN